MASVEEHAKSTNGNHVYATKTSKWQECWTHYVDNSTLHGLRNVFEKQPFILRRLIWLALVLTGAGIFISQLVSSIMYFCTYPISVNVKINYNDTIDFPAVTICNQNSFRMSASADHGSYPLLADIFGNGEKVNWSMYADSTTPMDVLYAEAAHRAKDLIVECEWAGDACGSDDFTREATDFGICYTFNGHHDESTPRRATQTGVDGGLRLLLNVEQYEYMPGPNTGAGLKMRLHGRHDVAAVHDHGLAIPPGSHAYLALQIVQIDNLEPPYGKCDDSQELMYHDYSLDACYAECRVRYVISQCGCVDIYMLTENVPVCSLKNYTECFLPALKSLDRNKECPDCPVPCKNVIYQPSVSYASLSNFDMLGLLHSNLTESLQEKYVIAREVNQRVTEQIVQEDTLLISRIKSFSSFLEGTLDTMQQKLARIRASNARMFEIIQHRTNYHLDRGLEEVQYITKHDFVRGWEIRKERYLDFVTANFYDVPDSFKRMAREINATVPPMDITFRKALWIVVDNMLTARLSLAQSAHDQISSANHSYATGDPMLTFRATIDRRYDMSYISLDILLSVASRRDEYVGLSLGFLERFKSSLDGMRELGKNFTLTTFYDPDQFEELEDDFISACKGYNYRIFLLEDRVILKALEVVAERIREFQVDNTTLYSAYETWENRASQIEELITNSKSNLWGQINRILDMSQAYLDVESAHKEPLARLVSSKNFSDTVLQFNTFFSDVRLLTKDLVEAGSALGRAYEDIWSQMLIETSTQAFYQMMHDDFTSYTKDPKTEADFIRIFAAMLRTKESAINATYPNMDLMYKLNADFHSTDLDSKLMEIKHEFEQQTVDVDIRRDIGAADETLEELFREYIRLMKDYLTGNEINTEFYVNNFMRLDVFMQELSYEQITQQRDYDVIKLLSDIGGSLGLFLGASVLSVVECLDVIFHYMVKQIFLGK